MLRLLGAAAFATALAAAGIATAAAEPPQAAGDARVGSLHVTSGIIVYAKSASLQGVWEDTKVKCSVSRRLTVRVDVY